MKPPPSKEPDPNRVIRAVVIGMGLVLIVGCIFLFVFAFKKMQDKAQESARPGGVIPREYRECGEHSLAIADLGSIREVQFDGPIAKVWAINTQGESLLYTVQGCSGEVLGVIKFLPTPPASE